MEKTTGYARVGDSRIAYQVTGSGPTDLVLALGSFVSFDTADEDPMADVYYRRLASFTRLIRFDRSGAGSSDPASGPEPATRAYGDEMLAVMDSVGVDRGALMAGYDAGPVAITLAVEHPDRVTALILANTTARFLRDDDYPIGVASDEAEKMIALVADTWGADEQAAYFIPSRAEDEQFRARFAKMQRLTLSPAEAAGYLRAMVGLDVRAQLGVVHVPTLVLHRSGLEFIPVAHGRYLADRITDARFVEVPGRDGPFVWEHPQVALDAIEEFLTGVHPEARADRAFATVVFSDIVGSTEIADEMGDRRWRSLLDAYDETAARVIASHNGTMVKHTGDGVMATFTRPGLAILAAVDLEQRAHAIGVDTRSGIHAGEVERRGSDVGGLAVHLAARVMDRADRGEVLVSGTVKDLVVGSDFTFNDRGQHHLKGLEGEWSLYAVSVGG